MSKVTDQALLKMLNEGSGKVSDPSLLSKLNSTSPVDQTVGVMKPQPWDNAAPNYVAKAPTKSLGRGQRMPDLGTQNNPFPRNQYGSANEGDFVKNQDGSTSQKVMSLGEKALSTVENMAYNAMSGAESTLPSALVASADSQLGMIKKYGGYTLDDGTFIHADQNTVNELTATRNKALVDNAVISNKYDLKRQNVPLSIDRANLDYELGNADGFVNKAKTFGGGGLTSLGMVAESSAGALPAVALSALTKNPAILMTVGALSNGQQEFATGIGSYLDRNGIPRDTWGNLPDDVIDAAIKETSIRTGIVVGAGVLGGNVASKMLIPRSLATTPAKAAMLNPLAQGVSGTVIDATGEKVAQVASGQPRDDLSVILEGAGGFPQQAAESLQATVHAMKLQGKNFVEVASNEELLSIATDPKAPKDMALQSAVELKNRGMAIDANGQLVTSAQANAQPQPLGDVGQPPVATQTPELPTTDIPAPLGEVAPTTPVAPSGDINIDDVIGGIFGEQPKPLGDVAPNVDDVFGKPQPPVQEPVQQGDTTQPPLTGGVTVPVAQTPTPVPTPPPVAPTVGTSTPVVTKTTIGANEWGVSNKSTPDSNPEFESLKASLGRREKTKIGKEAIDDLKLVHKDDVPQDLQDIFTMLEERSNTPIRLVINNNQNKQVTFGGVHMRNKGIWVVGNSKNNGFMPSVILFHELTHNMKVQDPDLYQRLADFVRNDTTYKIRTEFAKERGYSNLTADKRLEELVSDSVGNAGADIDFLKRLAKKDPNLFKDLADKLIKYLDEFLARAKALGKSKSNTTGSDKYLKDVEGFRNELEAVLIEHHKRGLARTASQNVAPINNSTDVVETSNKATDNEQKQTKPERDSDKGGSVSELPTKADEGTLQDSGDVGGSSELLGTESGQASKQDAKTPQSADKEIDGGSLNDINPEAIGKAIDRLLANAPLLSRINARLALKRAEKLLADGKITQEQYNNRISRIIENMDDVAADKRINKNAPTVRGELWIREKLLNAQRNGEISKETAEFAEWFIKQNPSLVDNLGISVRTAKGKDEVGSAGGYEIATRIMTLFNGSAKNTTAVHEVLHHLERMMPKDMQESIKKEWVKALQKALTSNDPVMKEFAENIVYGGKAGLTKATNMMREGKVDWKHYGLFNPSEYWAVNMTDTLDARYKAKDSVIKRTKVWLKEALEHIKSVLGMDSNSPLLKALNKLIKEGDGKFTDNPVTLGEQDGNLNDIAEVKDAVKGTVSTIEGFRSYMMDSLTSRAQALEKKVPELHKLFNKVIRYAGMDKRSDKTFSEYIEQQVTIFHNRVENIIQDAFGHDKQLSEDENNQLRDAILGLPVANQAIADAGKKLNHEMELIRAEAERLGIPIGEVTDIGYMPRVYKTKEIHENPQGFKDDAYAHFHDFEFEHEFGDRTVTYSSKENIARYMGLLRNFRNEPTISNALRAVRVQTRLIRTSKDPTVRQQAFAEAIRLLESVRTEAKHLYAEQRSQAWVNGARMKHDMKAFETNDARPKPTRERKLMGVADITMKDWLEQDVRYLLDKLNTVMAKKMALYNAYGNDPLAKIDSTLNNLVLDNKITLEQREEVGQILRDALGINREGIENNSVRKFGDMGHALGYTAMLERAGFASLFEASAYAFRSGDMKDIITPLRQLARTMFNQKDKIKTKEIALLIGIVARNAASNVNLHRIGISEGEYSKLPTKILHGYFKLNFLQTLTDDQRVLGIRIGYESFKRWAKRYQNGSATAKSFLDEHGINDTDAFATWIRSLPDIPTGNDIFDVDGRMTPMGAEFSTAIHRFISGSIQNPDATLKPAFASHPVGKYFAGIMSFAFSAYENIFKREAKILARVPANEKAQRLAIITLPTLVSLFVAQTIISALRMVLDGKDPDDDDLWEEAMYRGGSNVIGVGMFNQISNYIMGTKYESSAAETVVGAVPSYFLKSVDNINKPLSSRNSENTETAENKMGKGIYDFAVAPLATGALSLAPPQAKWLARIGLAAESSKQSRERFAEMFGTPPEKENSTDKKFKNYTSGGDKAKELVSKKLNTSNKEQWDAEFEKVKAEYPELLNGLELKRYADSSDNDKKGRSGEHRATPSGKPMLEGEALTANEDELKEISTINSRLDDLRKNKNATYNDIVDLSAYSKTAKAELEKLDDDGKADEISRSLKIDVIKEVIEYRTDIKKNIMKQKE